MKDARLVRSRAAPMKILFVHQNMPGQFKHLAPLMARSGHDVVFVTKRRDIEIPGVRKIVYAPTRAARSSTHHYLRLYENSVLHGQQVVRVCQDLAREGWIPDIVLAHPGWGESLFIKDVFQNTPILSYCEFYYTGQGADVGFDPAAPATIDDLCRARARNAHLLLSLEAADRGWSPTRWQRSRHPQALQPKIETIFDGIDTHAVRPDPAARLTLPNGHVLTPQDEVITYVARNLEPYRGFPSFMRALPAILAARPNAQVVVIGGDGVSYGAPPAEGGSWREVMQREVNLDPERVHFLGKVPHGRFVAALQVSSLHLYLTMPFVLSWSFMEAMAAGCLVLGSRTAPVEEMLVEGENGFFTDFFDPVQIAQDVERALSHPDRQAVRRAARQTILDRYDLTQCLQQQLSLIETVSGKPIVLQAN
jgi:glycosyltransferase involved in cell wall biosynthesis